MANEKQEIVNATPTGRAPRQRIPTKLIAKSLLNKMIEDSKILAVLRAQIIAHLNGAPPDDPTEQRRKGMAWAANVNFRELWSEMRSSAASAWNMFMSVENFYRLELKDPQKIEPQQEDLEYAEIIEEELSRTLRNWTNFNFTVLFRIWEMLKFGNGPCLWKDEWDWRCKAIRNSNLLVPGTTPSTLDEFDVSAVRGDISVFTLFEIMHKGPISEEAGWNLNAIRKVLVEKANGTLTNKNEPYVSSDIESCEQAIRNHDAADDPQFHDIRIFHMLSRESREDIHGRVTHQILIECDEEIEMLFERVGKFSSYRKAIGNFLWNIGDGYYKSVRGLAFELYPTKDISNRVANHILTQALFTSGVTLKGSGGKDSNLIPIQKRGPVNVVNPNYDVEQQAIFPRLNDLAEAKNMVAVIENNNAGTLRKRGEHTTIQRSATEASIEANNEARFENDMASWLYVQWKEWLTEVAIRLMNPKYPSVAGGYEEHREFVTRCKARGVPARLLNATHWNFDIVKAIGLGSPQQQMALTSALVNLSPMFPESGRQNALRDYIGTRFGYESANRYLGRRRDRQRIIKTDHTLAAIENQMFLQGATIPVGEDQFHSIHLPIHIGFMGQVVQAARSRQLPLERAVPAIGQGLRHSFEHLTILAKDKSRKGEVEKFNKDLNTIAQVFRQMNRILQKQKEEQKKQQAEQQERLRKLESDRAFEERQKQLDRESAERVEQSKTDGLNEERRKKTEASNDAKDKEVAAKIAREDRLAEAKIRNQEREPAGV